MTLKNKLKKEWLFLKREREQNFIEYEKLLGEKIDSHDFELINCDLATVLWQRLQSLGLNSKGMLIESGATYYDVTTNFKSFFDRIAHKFNSLTNQELYVLPFNWQKVGGLIIDSYTLMESLNDILFLYDDDLALYTEDFSSCLMFSGDRRGDDLYLLEVICKGSKWKNLIG